MERILSLWKEIARYVFGSITTRTPMMSRLRRVLIAVASSTALILLFTYSAYTLRLWPGGHSSIRTVALKALILLPLALGLVAGLWQLQVRPRDTFRAAIIGAGLGATFGYLGIRVLFWMAFGRATGFGESIFLHMLQWDLDVGAVISGVVAGTCALMLAITDRSWRVLLPIVGLVAVGLFLPAPLVNIITRNQELTLAFVVPGAGKHVPAPVQMGHIPITDIESEISHVHQALNNAGIGDDYQLVQLFRQGHGRKVLEIVVLDKPISVRTDLFEPNGSDVIYRQKPGGWDKIPSKVDTLDRQVYLWPPKCRRWGCSDIRNDAGRNWLRHGLQCS
jgi:hypothetical protein